MNTFICAYCKEKHDRGHKFYPVLDINDYCEATCSRECAKELKNNNIKIGVDGLTKVVNQIITEDIW